MSSAWSRLNQRRCGARLLPQEKGLEGAVPPAAFFKREGRLDLLMELRSVGGPRKARC